MILNLIIGYAIGFAAVVALTLLALRKEPTAHGQIVGRQVGCAVAFLWPVAVPYLLVRRAMSAVKGEVE